jgi:predicted metal-dependent phosphoesterase TrpH
MPNGQPFTALCQNRADLARPSRADLHIHTTASDGAYTPEQVVELARRSGLAAIAITDHDTLAGAATARELSLRGLQVVVGVEVTAEIDAAEVHVLGYFVDDADESLNLALTGLRAHRRERFHAMADRLRGCGASITEDALVAADANRALGRRTLANLLCDHGHVGSVREAFARYLADGGPADVPKERLPFDEALRLIRGAGGAACLAHPRATLTFLELKALRDRGLQAVEAEYPTHRASRTRELREWAAALEMAVTGGSDCHGPEPLHRGIGSRTITMGELDFLRTCTA